MLKAYVVRIDPARIFFRKEDKVYTLGLGESLQAALARGPTPLSEAEPFIPPAGNVAWQMRNAPWPYVLEWVTDQTGLPFATVVMPAGRFSWFDPKVEEQPKSYTVDEIVAIVAKSLDQRGYYLARRDKSLQILLKNDFTMLGAIGKVLKVDGAGVFFQVGRKAYAIRAGEAFADALARPLSADEIKKHGLKLSPVQ